MVKAWSETTNVWEVSDGGKTRKEGALAGHGGCGAGEGERRTTCGAGCVAPWRMRASATSCGVPSPPVCKATCKGSCAKLLAMQGAPTSHEPRPSQGASSGVKAVGQLAVRRNAGNKLDE